MYFSLSKRLLLTTLCLVVIQNCHYLTVSSHFVVNKYQLFRNCIDYISADSITQDVYTREYSTNDLRYIICDSLNPRVFSYPWVRELSKLINVDENSLFDRGRAWPIKTKVAYDSSLSMISDDSNPTAILQFYNYNDSILFMRLLPFDSINSCNDDRTIRFRTSFWIEYLVLHRQDSIVQFISDGPWYH